MIDPSHENMNDLSMDIASNNNLTMQQKYNEIGMNFDQQMEYVSARDTSIMTDNIGLQQEYPLQEGDSPSKESELKQDQEPGDEVNLDTIMLNLGPEH